MIPDSRKLKRGLKDISPLFDSAQEQEKELPPVPVDAPFQCLSLYSPGSPSEQLLVQTLLASQLIQQGIRSSILSLNPEHKNLLRSPVPSSFKMTKPLKRFHLSLDQFQDICSRSLEPTAAWGPNELLFLDFETSNILHFEKVMPLLDKWILRIKPEMESLTEAYKMLKASRPLNGRLEYFVLVDGCRSSDKASRLYERFSEIVGTHLGLAVNWLGTLQISNDPQSLRLRVDALLTKPALSAESLEKKAIASFLQSPAADGVLLS